MRVRRNLHGNQLGPCNWSCCEREYVEQVHIHPMTCPLNTVSETHLYLASSNCLINSKKLLGCFVFCSILRSTELFLHWKAAGSLILVLAVHHDVQISGINLKNVVLLEFLSGI